MFHVRTALELLGTAPETAWTELPLFHEMEERKGERRQAQGHTQRKRSAMRRRGLRIVTETRPAHSLEQKCAPDMGVN